MIAVTWELGSLILIQSSDLHLIQLYTEFKILSHDVAKYKLIQASNRPDNRPLNVDQ